MRTATVNLVKFGLIAVLLLSGCDLYEDDGPDLENSVTVKVYNESDCLLDLHLDGVDVMTMNPGDEYENTEVNRGEHLLEAYPWNDEQFSCDFTYTPDLKKDQVFEWLISNDRGCGDCTPTPTPVPDTPTPTPVSETPEPTSTPV